MLLFFLPALSALTTLPFFPYSKPNHKSFYEVCFRSSRGIRTLTTLILFLLSGLLAFLPGPASAQVRDRQEELPSIGGVYRRPLEFNPRNLDPAEAVDIYSVAVIQQLFDGLVQFDRELNILPALARSWKVSPDGLTYSFILREGVTFHNGREVTAEDAVYSFTRIVDARTKSPASHFLDRVLGARDFRDGRAESVRGLSARGKHLFEVKLTEPYAPFLSMLGMNKFKILPREEVERSGIPFARAPVGTGPFRFGSVKEGEEIVLEANTGYFEGRPFLDRIVFRVFHGAPREKIFREFKEGNLEESLVPAEELDAVAKEKRYLFFQKPILSLRFYGFNTAVKPLDNPKVRKALVLGVNRKAVLAQTPSIQFSPARGILPPGMPG
jgi:oligopeptide transport system substrate-binding protein